MDKEFFNSKTATGAGIGAVAGLLFGGPLGAAVGAVIGGAVSFGAEDGAKGVMTPKRKLIFTRAMEAIKDPEELEKLAAAFAQEGFPAEAKALQKRARLRTLPEATKLKRREYFRKAMASDKPDVILNVAAAFRTEGMYDAAKTLSEHADAVRAAHAAGKSTKPMAGGSVHAFADKLGKAIIHFGPKSPQAAEAARNLISARGKPVSAPLVEEVIRLAAEALQVPAPAAKAPPEEAIAIDATDGATGPADPPQTEPEAIEKPALGVAPPLEPEVLAGGQRVAAGPAEPEPAATAASAAAAAIAADPSTPASEGSEPPPTSLD